MKKHWNSTRLQKHYNRTLDDAKRHPAKFTDEELSTPYLDRLSKQTKSHRIMRMITLAYFLGKLKGISEIDEGQTPIVLS